MSYKSTNCDRDRDCDCGICFESLNLKCIDTSVQFDCGHYFHNKCIKPWCKKCIEDDTLPSCPLCRQIISNEYLDILDIDFYSNLNFNDIIISTRVIQLFAHIISNNIYSDKKKFLEYIEKYPNESDDIITMLQSYIMLNS